MIFNLNTVASGGGGAMYGITLLNTTHAYNAYPDGGQITEAAEGQTVYAGAPSKTTITVTRDDTGSVISLTPVASGSRGEYAWFEMPPSSVTIDAT